MELREHHDTIVAKATPPGVGGVGIVRISGAHVNTIAKKIIGKSLVPRKAEFLPFLNEEKEIVDHGIVLYFQGPNSLTGEDILELQGHGGPVILDQIIETVLNFGARLARPGEFLQRAFLNNKIDLLQAEAIQDLIESSTKAEARAALRSLQGVFSKKVEHLVNEVIRLRMFIEACIDFPEEELDLLKESELKSRLSEIIQKIAEIEQEANTGVILSKGIRTVIAGKPNAGKSSLLNALSGVDSAIVSAIPGTTRDALKETISIDGLKIELVDTAGLRETLDVIEQEGVVRAQKEIRLADHILIVMDINALGCERIKSDHNEDSHNESDQHKNDQNKCKQIKNEQNKNDQIKLDQIKLDIPCPETLLPELKSLISNQMKVTIFANKIDLLNTAIEPHLEQRENYSIVYGSLKTGEGLNLLKEHLKKIFCFLPGETTFTARRRHLDALNHALNHLQKADQFFTEMKGYEFVAEELRLAQLSLDEITGKFSSDDLLGKIFSEFCIGK